MANGFKITNTYFITISPPPIPYSTRLAYISQKAHIRKYLNKCSNKYIIWPEVTEKDLRLHYHGIFHMASYQKWFNTTKHSLELIGFVKIKLIRTLAEHYRVQKYIRKDYYKVEGALPVFMPKKIRRVKRHVTRKHGKNILDYLI